MGEVFWMLFAIGIPGAVVVRFEHCSSTEDVWSQHDLHFPGWCSLLSFGGHGHHIFHSASVSRLTALQPRFRGIVVLHCCSLKRGTSCRDTVLKFQLQSRFQYHVYPRGTMLHTIISEGMLSYATSSSCTDLNLRTSKITRSYCFQRCGVQLYDNCTLDTQAQYPLLVQALQAVQVLQAHALARHSTHSVREMYSHLCSENHMHLQCTAIYFAHVCMITSYVFLHRWLAKLAYDDTQTTNLIYIDWRRYPDRCRTWKSTILPLRRVKRIATSPHSALTLHQRLQ